MLNKRTMGVTRKDRRNASRGRLETEFGEVMDHVEGLVPDL